MGTLPAFGRLTFQVIVCPRECTGSPAGKLSCIATVSSKDIPTGGV
jgi:hypothetical protein